MKYSVRWRADSFSKRPVPDRKREWEYARYETQPNRGSKITFTRRCHAVRWVRNHQIGVDPATCTILHSDGTEELYYPGNPDNLNAEHEIPHDR